MITSAVSSLSSSNSGAAPHPPPRRLRLHRRQGQVRTRRRPHRHRSRQWDDRRRWIRRNHLLRGCPHGCRSIRGLLQGTLCRAGRVHQSDRFGWQGPIERGKHCHGGDSQSGSWVGRGGIPVGRLPTSYPREHPTGPASWGSCYWLHFVEAPVGSRSPPSSGGRPGRRGLVLGEPLSGQRLRTWPKPRPGWSAAG